MNRIVLSISLILLIVCIFHQDVYSSSIEISSPEIQLGKISGTEDIKGSFVIGNVGKTTLLIKKIRPSCDCLVIPSYPSDIASGGQAEIEFVLDPKTLKGVFTKYIYIQSSDPKKPLVRINVSGEVVKGERIIDKDIELFLFYSSGCRHCRKVRDVILPRLVKEYPRLNVKEYDITDIDNYTYMMDFEERFGVKETAPVIVFVGERYFAGYKSIQEGLERYISLLFKGNKEYWPPSEVRWIKRFSFFTIVFAGLLDGLNPCAFVTIVFLISLLSVMEKKRYQILNVGLIFAGAVFISYLLIGFGIFQALYRLRIFLLISNGIYYFSIILVFIFGLLSLYDLVVYALTGDLRRIKNQLPGRIKIRMHEILRDNFGKRGLYIASGITGFWISILEGVCTGQVYLPIIMLMNSERYTQKQALGMLIIYNLVFILPLLLVCGVTFLGVSYNRLRTFSRRNVLISKFLLSLLFLGLGILLLIS